MCPPRPEPRLSAPAQPVVRLRPRTPTLDPRTLALLLFSGLYRSVSFSGRTKTEILDAGAAMTKAQAGEGSRRSDRTPDSSVRSAGGGGRSEEGEEREEATVALAGHRCQNARSHTCTVQLFRDPL